ncbi:WD repeat-containing protein 78 [Xyrichtys novacula]|uniref:Dynein axonemal intermediate chain 4 n=1 Tax=Xyrichtys novacula TaxID=13765 RepID=A0AAV1F4Q5_XYRNO|nr:WD repeat-containing protein 78 [Xyrichtys novacula]
MNMNTHAESMKKTSLTLNSSSRGMTNSISGLHKVGLSSRHKWSFTGSLTRKGSILAGRRGSKLSVLDDRSEVPRAVQVLNEDGNDVTPLPLHQEEQGDKFKQGTFFLEEIFSSTRSDHLKSTSTFNLPTASSFMGSSPTSSMRASMTKESDDSVLDIPTRPPAPYEVPRKRETVEQQLTEEMLDEVIDVLLHETDTMTLLDIPNTFVSVDAEEAEAVEKANVHYAELCKNRLGNDKYVDRPSQTFNGALKTKQTQSVEVVTVDEGTMATTWEIYNSFCDKNETAESEGADFLESAVNTSSDQERKDDKSSSSCTTTTGTNIWENTDSVSRMLGTAGSTVSSLNERESNRSSANAEPSTQLILSESFQQSLIAMERCVVANLIQTKLAAYRKLPILEDPESTERPEAEEQSEESSLSPTVEPLWSLSCELTRGCSITCMALNKENPDLLSVGHGDDNTSLLKPGFICSWSLMHPSRPERIFHCHSGVTSLDFSSKNSGQLAVGMYDGTVAIYNVTTPNGRACIASSSACSKRHRYPVWQVKNIKQELSEKDGISFENIVAASNDRRVTQWLLCDNVLDCMELFSFIRPGEEKPGGLALPAVSSVMCIDFHPTNSRIYLVGTYEGNIHKCSIYDNQSFVSTYKKHNGSVNDIQWSPFCPDVFLSCSSDWSIQLWRQDLLTPVLNFESNKTAVCTVRWSPHWSTVFAAITGGQLEIWDLNSNILKPTIVQPAPPGVTFTSLLFTRETDCLLVGDSDGQVTVYQIKNLNVGDGKQVNDLESIISSRISR